MALNTRPFWTPDVTVLNTEVTSGNKATSAGLDLTQKRGAWLYITLCKLDTTALSGEPLAINVRPSNSDASINHPNSNESRIASATDADASTTINVTVAQNARVVTVTATTNFAVGDKIYIGNADATLRPEVAKVVQVNAGGPDLVVDADIINEHTSGDADIVVNKADVFERIWIGGGSMMLIEANYLAAADGPDMWVSIFAQTYDGDGTPA